MRRLVLVLLFGLLASAVEASPVQTITSHARLIAQWGFFGSETLYDETEGILSVSAEGGGEHGSWYVSGGASAGGGCVFVSAAAFSEGDAGAGVFAEARSVFRPYGEHYILEIGWFEGLAGILDQDGNVVFATEGTIPPDQLALTLDPKRTYTMWAEASMAGGATHDSLSLAAVFVPEPSGVSLIGAGLFALTIVRLSRLAFRARRPQSPMV